MSRDKNNAAFKRGRILGDLRHPAYRQYAEHADVCCADYFHGSPWETIPWDWDENNNRVCAKCGESLEGRYK